MSTKPTHSIKRLTDAILKFSETRPDTVHQFDQGQRIIKQGDLADDCFLIEDGAVSILVQTEATASEIQIALRFQGDLVGETAFLQQNTPRTASVVVVSQTATVVRLTRNDIFSIIRDDPETQETISLLSELGTLRESETIQVIKGEISVENQLMSALIGDIHNFTALGEVVWEEHANSFLFDFIEQAEQISNRHDGLFEDQGDGFKVVCSGSYHATNAAQCAQEFVRIFENLRSVWCEVNDAFASIGLGIGLCCDFMSIRKRQGSPRQIGRILGHAINIASALAKFKTAPNDINIFVNENARILLDPETFKISEPHSSGLKNLVVLSQSTN